MSDLIMRVHMMIVRFSQVKAVFVGRFDER